MREGGQSMSDEDRRKKAEEMEKEEKERIRTTLVRVIKFNSIKVTLKAQYFKSLKHCIII